MQAESLQQKPEMGGDMLPNDVKNMSDKEVLDELQAIGISQINWPSYLKNRTGSEVQENWQK